MRRLTFFAFWTFWEFCARGKAALPEPAPELIAPVAKGQMDVPYPDGADGDSAVELELIVESDGQVSSATVLEGAEPFAERARSTALSWRFEPARRGETPIRARIRARVEFHREEEPAPAAAASATPPLSPPAAASSAPPAPPEPPVEVTVVGERREIGQTTLSKSDVREMPGAFGDAFRAIEALPGVAPLVSGIPYFYVRGAPPNNAGYFFDGVRSPAFFPGARAERDSPRAHRSRRLLFEHGARAIWRLRRADHRRTHP